MRIYINPTLYGNISDDRLWTITKESGEYFIGDSIKKLFLCI